MPDQTHEPPPIPPHAPAPTPVPFPMDSPPMSEKDVSEGKAFAIISYVLNFLRLPFWLVPLIMRENEFALYHAKQCMLLWITVMVGMAVGAMLIPFCGIGLPVMLVIFVGAIVLDIIGLVHALNGQAKPLPVLGVYAEKWFRGIRKNRAG